MKTKAMIFPFRLRAFPRRKFTILELLIVVGLIAMLVSLFLPALAKVRESSVSVLCLSNLKQVALAQQLYANDYGSCFVISSYVVGFGNENQNSWTTLLTEGIPFTQKAGYPSLRYIRRKTLACPLQKERTLSGDAKRDELFDVYGMLYPYNSGDFTSPFCTKDGEAFFLAEIFGDIGFSKHTYSQTVQNSSLQYTINTRKLKNPSKYPMVADSINLDMKTDSDKNLHGIYRFMPWGLSSQVLCARHREKSVNAGYADGHAGNRSWSRNNASSGQMFLISNGSIRFIVRGPQGQTFDQF